MANPNFENIKHLQNLGNLLLTIGCISTPDELLLVPLYYPHTRSSLNDPTALVIGVGGKLPINFSCLVLSLEFEGSGGGGVNVMVQTQPPQV